MIDLIIVLKLIVCCSDLEPSALYVDTRGRDGKYKLGHYPLIYSPTRDSPPIVEGARTVLNSAELSRCSLLVLYNRESEHSGV